MNLSVDPDDPTPPYEQLRRQLADLVEAGTLVAGERLPPLRQLAGDLGLAVGTVARAYRELEAAGLLSPAAGAAPGWPSTPARRPRSSVGRAWPSSRRRTYAGRGRSGSARPRSR